MKDITAVIESVQLKKGVSKAGTEYTYIEIQLINKGTEKIFLNADSRFKWDNAVEMAEALQEA